MIINRIFDPPTSTTPPALVWADLTRREPRLAALLAKARAVFRGRGEDYDPLAAFFGYPGCGDGFKARLSGLVGWGRPDNDPVLCSSDAYDVAYQTILDALEGVGDEP
jgi:hypothetical protein